MLVLQRTVGLPRQHDSSIGTHVDASATAASGATVCRSCANSAKLVESGTDSANERSAANPYWAGANDTHGNSAELRQRAIFQSSNQSVGCSNHPGRASFHVRSVGGRLLHRPPRRHGKAASRCQEKGLRQR